MAIDARDDLIVVSEGLLGFDNLFDNNNFGNDIDAVEIVSIDIGGGPQAVGAGVVTSNFDLGVLSVGNVGFPGQNLSFDAGAGYDFLSFGEQRDATFTYVARDAGGLTDSATVTIRIIGLNDQPDAVDDAFGTPGNPPVPFLENTPLNANVLTNDSDVDASDTFTVTAVNGGGIGGNIALSAGTLTMNANGAFTYNYTGANLAVGATFTETFDYTITDSAILGALSDTASVSITVIGTNADPIAVNDAFSIDQNVLLNQDVTPAVIGQDNDPDGDAITVSAVNGGGIGGVINLASGAQVTMDASGAFTYDQNGAFAGLAVGATANDSFQYTITDGNGGFDTATATITVTGINGDPIAVNDSFSVGEDAVLSDDVTPGTVGQDRDPNGDAITVTAVNGGGIGGVINLASGAQLEMNLDGTFDYNTNGAFNGLKAGETATDSFQYTITDGNGGFDTATATITINGDNDQPIAVDDVFSVSANVVLNQDVTPGTLGQDSDPDGDALSVTAVNGGGIGGVINLGSGASVTMNANGTFSYNQNGAFAGLAPGASANDSFQYTISDGNGGVDTATAFITVNGVDNPPIVTNIGADLLVGCQTLLSFNLLNAKDPEGSSRNQLTYTVESAPTSGGAFLRFGQVLQAGDTFTQADIHGGLVEFRHNDGGPAGAFNLDLTVTDKTGATTAPFTFTVNVKTPDEVQIGTNGQDNLFGGNGDSALTGLAGNDGLFGHGGDDCLRGGDGNDGLFAHGGDDVIHGGAGNDQLDGNDGDDRLFGGDGDDMVWGNNGVDVMTGGNGNDEMAGGAGDDIIYGNFGDDMICGNEGDDFIFGGSGDDVIAGAGGNDELLGGNGRDTLYGNEGNDRINGGKGNDLITGDSGLDRLIGSAGDDVIHGGGDRDILNGGGGNDRMFGDDGNDVLFGAAGSDSLTGGSGRDIFLFNVGVSDADRVEDFDPTQDFVRFVNGGPADFAALVPLLQQVGFDTVIDFGAGTELTLAFTNASTLNASDFHFFS